MNNKVYAIEYFIGKLPLREGSMNSRDAINYLRKQVLSLKQKMQCFLIEFQNLLLTDLQVRTRYLYENWLRSMVTTRLRFC
jgi:hypothetical protein